MTKIKFKVYISLIQYWVDRFPNPVNKSEKRLSIYSTNQNVKINGCYVFQENAIQFN